MSNSPVKKDSFCHLHLHSSYSFTDGYGLPEEYIKRCKELGQPAMACTDHGNCSVHYKWYKGCNKEGIKPVLGCEMYIVESKNEIRERGYNHITILVKNSVGYKNLMALITKSYLQMYYKPRITYQDLFDHQEGLIVLSGCPSSPFLSHLRNGDEKGALEKIELFRSKIDNFWIEIMPTQFKEGAEAYKKLIDLYKGKLEPDGMKMVATNDCHYVLKGQHEIQEVLLCIQSNDKMNNPDRWKLDANDLYLKSRKEMEESLASVFPGNDFTEALDNTVRIAESVDFTFPKAQPIVFPMEESEKMPFLREETRKGLARMGKEADEKYRARATYELDLIAKKNFVDYFLVIHDLVNWAKSEGILVGHGRGSAAGSLVCCALRITEVDPIEWGLIFERFIDINREDTPDIDIDFEDSRRGEVKEYLQRKYGAEKVGGLPTYAEFKSKSALKDVGRVFSIPIKTVDEVASLVIERSGGDSRASFTLEDTFSNPIFTKAQEAIKKYPDFKYAVSLEGQLRQMGRHAAAIMISNEPLTNFCAIYSIKGEKIISLDYKDASDIGLLKIDLLGLRTLSVISKTIKTVERIHGKKIDAYKLPLDDKKTYKGFISEKLFGVFQFDGQAVNQVCRQIKPKDFESLSAISALARPGPLNAGSTTEYILRKTGKHEVSFEHPIMESITKDTYGIVIYQEQVMRIMREIGKMSWKDTSEIRKLISKSQGVEKFNTFRDHFIPGALENGLSESVSNKIWDAMCSYGSWSFNKAHSVSYGMLSYVTMWLKVHYPIEFYEAILSLTEIEDKRKKILKEYKREGLKILSIDINKSKLSFSIEEKGLRIGFLDIKGIGEMAAKTIVKYQPYSNFFDFIKKTEKKRITEKLYGNLINLGAFDSIEKESKELTLFGEMKTPYEKIQLSLEDHFVLCPWDVDFGIDKRVKDYFLEHKKDFTSHPVSISDLKEMKTGFNEDEFIVYGIVYDKNLRDVREVSASKGRKIDLEKYRGLYQFANFILEDDTDFVTIRLGTMKFPEYGRLIFQEIKSNDIVVVKGKMGSGIRMFFANKIMKLPV